MIKYNNYKKFLENNNFKIETQLEDFIDTGKITFICIDNHITTITCTSFANKKIKYKNNIKLLCTDCGKEEDNKINFEKYSKQISENGHKLTKLDPLTRKCSYECGNCGEIRDSYIQCLLKKDVTSFCQLCINDKNKKTILDVDKELNLIGYKCIEYNNNKNLKVKCVENHIISSLSFYDYKRGRRCPECAVDQRKDTNIRKYGSECIFSSEYFKNKSIETCLIKYGETHHMKNPDIKEKMMATNLEKYGVPYAFNMECVYEKIKQKHLENWGVEYPLQSMNIQKKIQETFIEKIGVKYPMLNKEYWKGILFDKYGVEHYSKTEDFKEKYEATCMEKYGVEHYSKSEDFKEKYPEMLKKYEATCMEKYGVRHPMQNEEIFIKAQKKMYKIKPFTFPSGTIVMVQGYEPYCIRDLIKKYNYEEDDIIVDYKKMPKFIYAFEDKLCRYYPDIMLKDKFIEVKSLYTYELNLEKNLKKWNSVIENGYEIEIWIYNKDGTNIKRENYELT